MTRLRGRRGVVEPSVMIFSERLVYPPVCDPSKTERGSSEAPGPNLESELASIIGTSYLQEAYRNLKISDREVSGLRTVLRKEILSLPMIAASPDQSRRVIP